MKKVDQDRNGKDGTAAPQDTQDQTNKNGCYVSNKLHQVVFTENYNLSAGFERFYIRKLKSIGQVENHLLQF